MISALLALIALPAAADNLCQTVRFRDAAAEAGIVFTHDPGSRGDKHLPESMGAGLAWLDYDGDGWQDLYAVQSGPFPPDGSAAARDRLFRNRGGGVFEDVTERAGLDVRSYGQGVLAADLDGDGATDLYVTAFGADAFLRNRGDGTFEDAKAAAGLGADGWSSSAAAADGDGDGDLDLYVTRYLVYDPKEELFCGDFEKGIRRYCDPVLFEAAPDVYYRREGGRYVDATAAAGLGGVKGKGLGVVFADLDGDRRPDLYVANDLTPNFLFRNLGGTFEDVSLFSGAAANTQGLYEAGMGIALGDLDGDGDPEIAVTNFDVETNTLYENLGKLQFADVSARSGFGVPSFNLLGFGIALADLDGDGDLDAWIANGHIFERPARENVTHAQRDVVLLGDGRGGFRELACPWLGPPFYVGRGLAVADADNDGDVDVAVANNAGPLQLWTNESRPGDVGAQGIAPSGDVGAQGIAPSGDVGAQGIAPSGDVGAQGIAPSGRWLGLSLRGPGPNTEAVGAVVDLVDAGGRRQRRWVLAGESYQSSSDRRLLFGLGASEPAALEVTWPSGRKWRLAAPPAGKYLVYRGR